MSLPKINTPQLIIHILAVLCIAVSSPAHSGEINYYSEHYPPFNYQSGYTPKGIAVELLDLMLKQLEAPHGVETVQFVPWPRGYLRVLKKPDSVLFSTFLTPSRLELFKWVGPIVSTRNGLIVRSYIDYHITDLRTLRGYRIGIIKNDIGGILLREMRIPGVNIITLTNPEKAAKMLEQGRLDAWAYDINVASAIQVDLGLLPAEYTVPLYLGEPGLLYFAFNPETDDKTVARYQQALETAKHAINEQGENLFSKILDRYNYRRAE